MNQTGETVFGRTSVRIKRHGGRLRIGGSLIETLLLLLLGISLSAPAQNSSRDVQTADVQPASVDSALSLSSTTTRRFVAVHGQRSLVMGYPQDGLEIWAYPLQILAGYQIGFKPSGATSETDGRLLLSRIIEEPDSITRIYTGPDYVVREKLFVPLDQPSAILTYEVNSRRPMDIDIHFTPVLNLMWPGALGGQSTEWDADLPGYILNESVHGLSAVVSSPEIVSHDETVNSTVRTGQMSFSIQPRIPAGATADAPALATLYVTLLSAKDSAPAASLQALSAQVPAMEAQAAAHYQALRQDAIRIQTPDDDVNSALAWAEIALDQAWVCNPQLGCGLVAGYGPSRPGRRPQYAWFFAGDGLIATNALVSAGEYARARDELEFIAKYQDKTTGMVWHELSQSAGYLDWSKYPYMFVHVDITFDYLNTVARYVAISGDTGFATRHWSSIAAAYQYCRSLISPSDNLPHIPPGKEGGDEQHRPADDLGLSISWVAASRSFATLANNTGHTQLADEAVKDNQLARQAIPMHYWDAQHNFWIDGHTASGAPIFTRRSGPSEAILENVFSPQQNDQILDQVASSKFQTDWGTRSAAADSAIYDPWSYATGSIWALHSAGTAAMFWSEHRPDIAWSLWRAIVPWNTLDSLGHIHEVLAGNFYRPQTESVPEQTWSSAGLLDSAVRGLIGIEIHRAQNSLVFRPHLPAEWNQISIANIHLPHSTLALTMSQAIDGIDLEIRNDGSPAAIAFEPQIPLGAHLSGAEFDGHSMAADAEQFAEDAHAKLEIHAPSGTSHCHITFSGGVSLILPQYAPRIGDPGTGLKVTGIHLQGRQLSVDADVNSAGGSSFRIRTPWREVAVKGATIQSLPNHLYEVQIQKPSSLKNESRYASTHIEINFDEQ